MTAMRGDEAQRLTPFEDGLLRRLFYFESAGAALAPPLRMLQAELRARDQRLTVRQPEQTVARPARWG